MFIVKTELRSSPIQGYGIFAAEPLKAQQLIWQWIPQIDITFPEHILETLPEVARNYLKRYACYNTQIPGLMCLDADHSRFMNHSDDPNTDFSTQNQGFMKFDIEIGQELTCHYGEFEGDKFDRGAFSL